MLKDYTLVQLMFSFDIILPIKYNTQWKLIHNKNQEKPNKDNNHENRKIVDYRYKVGENIIINDKYA